MSEETLLRRQTNKKKLFTNKMNKHTFKNKFKGNHELKILNT